METLTITLAQVQAAADNMRTQNQKLNHCLQDINTTMNQLAAYWQSPASETLRSRFHSLLPVFDKYQSIVESYARFLDQTADTYHSLEQQLQAGADQFR